MGKRIITFFTALVFLSAPLLGAKSSDKPVIGISPSSIKGRFGVTDGYTLAVSRGGGIPVILPAVFNEKDAETVIERVDGILMTGGEDVNPALYGEDVLNSTVGFNASRDSVDVLLIRAALRKHKPILAICRGSQILNVVLGGTLYQDIPTQLPGSQHRQPGYLGNPYHKIGLAPGSILHEIYGCDSLMVNSGHHQAVKDIAPSLNITARAADGVVEAYEGKGIIAMQFHPESLLYGGDDNFARIFEYFAERCRKGR